MPTLHETMFYVKGLEYVVALIFLTGFVAFWQLAIGRGLAEAKKEEHSERTANATAERAQPLALPGKPGPGLINAPKWDTGSAHRPS